MRAENETRTFNEMCHSVKQLNKIKDKYMPTCPDFSDEEFRVITGRYAGSHPRYKIEAQFWINFLEISIENLPRLRAKLRANDLIRNFDTDEILEGEKVVETNKREKKNLSNEATNPDTKVEEPMKPLEYIDTQNVGQEHEEIENTKQRTLPKVLGVYEYKHRLGSQAYNEFLDAYRGLFRTLIAGKHKTIYIIERE